MLTIKVPEKLHPRIYVGASIGATHTAAKQIYGGLSWTLTSSGDLFTEAGFGGVVHDGNLSDENDGPKLGCHLLFHEYVGAGYDFDSHWSLMALSTIRRMPISATARMPV